MAFRLYELHHAETVIEGHLRGQHSREFRKAQTSELDELATVLPLGGSASHDDDE